ncbi:MAG: hypothetical protein NTU80_10465 [Verrucomicrobia bacterium]|nr:hypothetical protein [Verrucomicrobiota bacterium]
MRLLSFLNQVETTLAMLRPEESTGWHRRADYQTGVATWWHPALGLVLGLRCCALGNDRYSIQTRWSGPTGAVLQDRTFFCGSSSFEWQTAAETVAEAMPEGTLSDPGSLMSHPDSTSLNTATA